MPLPPPELGSSFQALQRYAQASDAARQALGRASQTIQGLNRLQPPRPTAGIPTTPPPTAPIASQAIAPAALGGAGALAGLTGGSALLAALLIDQSMRRNLQQGGLFANFLEGARRPIYNAQGGTQFLLQNLINGNS